MDLQPSIRTAPSAPSRVDYARYLQSQGWRTTRNAKLRAVFWQCERCPARRGLQVHHKTYERLGHEFLSDLEVLCADCHEGEHIRAMHDDPTGRVYLRLAREVLNGHTFDSFAELVAEMKTHCAKLRLPYDAHQVDKAIGLVSGNAKFSAAPQTREARVEAFREQRPISAAEARSLVKRLFGGAVSRTIPEPRGEDPKRIDIYAPVPMPDCGEQDRY